MFLKLHYIYKNFRLECNLKERKSDNPGTQILGVETGDVHVVRCSDSIGGNSNQLIDSNAKRHSVISSNQINKIENDCNFNEPELH